MESRSSTRGPVSSHGASTAWLISFGDLLTLLVCFFLVLTRWHADNLSGSTGKSRVHTSLGDGESAGIAFAHPSLGPAAGVVVEIPVLVSLLGTEVAAHTESFQRDVMSVSAQGNVTVFRVCNGESGFQALRQLGSIVRASVAPTGVFRLEVSGDCRDFDVLYPTSGEVVGAVRILKE